MIPCILQGTAYLFGLLSTGVVGLLFAVCCVSILFDKLLFSFFFKRDFSRVNAQILIEEEEYL